MTTLYAIQVTAAAVGALLGYLAVSNFILRKRIATSEARLANLELWASGASPIIMGLVAVTGIQGVDIEEAQKVTKH